MGSGNVVILKNRMAGIGDSSASPASSKLMWVKDKYIVGTRRESSGSMSRSVWLVYVEISMLPKRVAFVL
jgi:hypothetical protein